MSLAVLALVGGLMLGVALTLVVLRMLHSRKNEDAPESEGLDSRPKDVYEAAFNAVEGDGSGPDLIAEGGTVVFGLPPNYVPPENKMAPQEEDPTDKQIEVENHPCTYLSEGSPPNYKPSECSGLCHAPGQRGRPCFWASSGASKCPYFKPRVNPTRVKLKKVG